MRVAVRSFVDAAAFAYEVPPIPQLAGGQGPPFGRKHGGLPACGGGGVLQTSQTFSSVLAHGLAQIKHAHGTSLLADFAAGMVRLSSFVIQRVAQVVPA